MRHTILLIAFAAWSTAALAQDVQDRVFRFSQIRAPKEVQEVATLVRSIGDIRQVSTDLDQPSISIQGTAAQIALCEWLVNELDSAPNRAPVTREYRMPDSRDDVVRVFYLTDARTVGELQEAATMIRAITEIRRLFTYGAPRAIVLRGPQELVTLAEWLLTEMHRQPSTPSSEHRVAGQRDGVVRVFRFKPALPTRDLQEMATLVRSISDIRRLFTYGPLRLIAVRGKPEEIELAQWLIAELDSVAERKDARQYQTIDGEFVRVFHVKNATSVEALHAIATEVRQATMVRRLFTFGAPRAMAIRGTAEQIATADRMISERRQ